MAANKIVPSKVAVGATAVQLSAWNPSKEYTLLQMDKANTLLIYLGGDSTVTTTSGFGELAQPEVITIEGPAAVWGISSGAAQNVRVLEGLK